MVLNYGAGNVQQMYQGLKVLPELLGEFCGGFVGSLRVAVSDVVSLGLVAGGSQVSSQSSLSITLCCVLSSSFSVLPALQQRIKQNSNAL